MKSFFNYFTFDFLIPLVYSLRPLNLVLIILTQTLTSVFLLDNSLCKSNLFNFNPTCISLYILILATVLSAAAGYILNDIFDQKIDLINAAKRGIFTQKNRCFLSVLSSLFFLTALGAGFFVSIPIGFGVLIPILLLIFYGIKSKKIGILKPIIVSFLTSFSTILVGIAYGMNVLIWLFAFWAFLLSMLREIIKDLEDLKGDRLENSFTSAIQLGKNKSIFVLYFISSLLLLSVFCSFFIVPSFASGVHKIIMLVWIGIFLFKLNTNYSYKKLSLVCKLMMLTGILGMVAYGN